MKILDVGGCVNPYKGATHIIDVLPRPSKLDQKIEYTQKDVCQGKWPYEDKEFDMVYCSNLLEDVKDPIHVCNELMRVAKKGTIIVPSPWIECRKGVDVWPGNEHYAGFVHHRWICFYENNTLVFMQKTPISTVYNWTKGMTDEDIKNKAFLKIEWKDQFLANEIVYADWHHWYAKLKSFFGIDPKGDNL